MEWWNIKSFTLLVNYDIERVAEQIEMGRYDRIDPDCPEIDFKNDSILNQLSGVGELEVRASLVVFTSPNQVIRDGTLEWERDHYKGFPAGRPAQLLELLSFGIHFPGEQLERRVVAYGSFFRDPRYAVSLVPSLGRKTRDEDAVLRTFDLTADTGFWSDHASFLMVEDPLGRNFASFTLRLPPWFGFF